MANNTANVQQVYEIAGDEVHEDVPVKAAAVIYEGDAISRASGYARQLNTADTNFGGFALRKSDNSAAGAADGDQSVRVRTRGHAQLSVVGVVGVSDVGSTVYASDGATFTLTAGGNTSIGKVERFVSGTKVIVAFEADVARSI
jgi:hypothetical protein